MAQVISRMQDGEAGILPSGIAHPEVESTIAAASRPRPAARPPPARPVRPRARRLVSDVRVHTDTADSLTRSVSARSPPARDIFFAPGEYQPHSATGRELIAHEVAHVVQQLGAPMSGPLVVSNPGDADRARGRQDRR